MSRSPISNVGSASTNSVSDYHLHLHPHGFTAPVELFYGDGIIERYVAAACEQGVTEVGFTEHLYRCVEAADVLGYFWQDEPAHIHASNQQMMELDVTLSLDGYVETVLAGNTQGLPVKLGLEVDFFPETIDAVVGFLAPYPFDHLIESVHWMGGLAVDPPWGAAEMRQRGLEACWDEYFGLLEQLGGSGPVDALAHADLVKKYGDRVDPEPVAWYERVAKAASMSGTAVEVSSAGLRSPAQEEYPSPTFVMVFDQFGVPVTLASDVHEPSEGGSGHAEVVNAARRAGYTSQLRFNERRSEEVELT
jgi:histidinol-phosphatase (PHP family)